MSIKQQIDQDLKAAMLAGNKDLVMTLRGVKSAILYAEVAKDARETGLPEAELIDLLSKESKKRQESADMYTQGGSSDRAEAELAEKEVINGYLPAQLSDAELKSIIESIIDELDVSGAQAMGQVISEVKKRTQGQADGGRIANLVREALA